MDRFVGLAFRIKSFACIAGAVLMLLPCRPLVGTAHSAVRRGAGQVIVIDPGHTTKLGGATSVTGKPEVSYNDAFASKLIAALGKAGFIPHLTRKPDQEIKLDERPAVANQKGALLLLSIHHDSAQLAHLEPVTRNGNNTYRTRTPISGYSIFVSEKNAQFESSSRFARLLGQRLLKLGRKPTLHHAEAIPGEGRPLLDTTLGIYRFDELVVLRKAEVPAVLLEVGVIVDEGDEAYVSDGRNQDALVAAVVEAVRKFAAKK